MVATVLAAASGKIVNVAHLLLVVAVGRRIVLRVQAMEVILLLNTQEEYEQQIGMHF